MTEVVATQVRTLLGMARNASAAYPRLPKRERGKESNLLAEGAEKGRAKKKGRADQATGRTLDGTTYHGTSLPVLSV